MPINPAIFSERPLVFCFGPAEPPQSRPEISSDTLHFLETEPFFREALEACDAHVLRRQGWSVLETLKRPELLSPSDSGVWACSTVCLQLALAHALKGQGYVPDAVLCVSSGELAAAFLYGGLQLLEATDIALAVAGLFCQGAQTLWCSGPAEQVQKVVRPDLEFYVAAEYGQMGFAVSVRDDGAEQVRQAFTTAGIGSRKIFARFGGHSPLIDHHHEEFRSGLVPLRLDAAWPYYSSHAGGRIRSQDSVEYLWNVVRYLARVDAAVDAVLRDGFRNFVTVWPSVPLEFLLKLQAHQLGTSVQVHSGIQ